MRLIVIKLKYVIFAAMAVAAVVAVVLTTASPIMTFVSGNRNLPIYSVKRNDNKVALTFDCAWNDDDIEEIVDTLTERGCGATFFLTGKWAEDYRSSVNKLYRSGFEIGLHSYNHDDYTKLSADEITNDIIKCAAIIKRITGETCELVRVPSGAYNDTAIKTIEDSGRICIQWSVDGLDYIETTPEQICERVTENVHSGDIILLHNGTKYTADVLAQIIDNLQKKYEIVSVSDMIYKDNFTVDRTGQQIPNPVY